MAINVTGIKSGYYPHCLRISKIFFTINNLQSMYRNLTVCRRHNEFLHPLALSYCWRNADMSVVSYHLASLPEQSAEGGIITQA